MFGESDIKLKMINTPKYFFPNFIWDQLFSGPFYPIQNKTVWGKKAQ